MSKGNISIHTENIFPIIKKWLYSEHDIFLRELISNAVDAMNKRKIVDSSFKANEAKIEIKLDEKEKTIQIIDSGIGMSKEEVEKYINQIAFSSAEEFVEKFKDQQEKIIGHFGLGFYSAFMVSQKVQIDTLSYKEGSKAVRWECEGETSFEIGESEKNEIGTIITLYLSKESEEYSKSSKIKELVKKYCNFMGFPIEFEGKVLNQKTALWNKKPSEVSEEEYKDFYKELFVDFEDPLFWIHLNADFPFNIKGILYFPKIKNQLDVNRGKVKLYCNNVFVADNLKDLIPDFLLLLRGGIDIPDIPLNVSRSFLQNDNQIQKITKYIIKKISDKLKEIFTEDRKKFESYWKDISQFIKYGLVTEDSFYDSFENNIIFAMTDKTYLTLDEYLSKSKSEDEEKKIYYSNDEHSQYVSLLNEEGIKVIFANDILDTHLFQKLEYKKEKIKFVRVDSELNENFLGKEAEIVDKDNKTISDKLKEIFVSILDNDKVEVEAKSLKFKDLVSMVIFNEHTRRFAEMNFMSSKEDSLNMLENHKLVVNTQSPIAQKIIDLKEVGKNEDVEFLCKYVHEMAMVKQGVIKGKDFQKFLDDSTKVLNMYCDK